MENNLREVSTSEVTLQTIINHEEAFIEEEPETEGERLEREMEEEEDRHVSEANRPWIEEHRQRLYEICERSWEKCITVYNGTLLYCSPINMPRPPENLMESQGIINHYDDIWEKRFKLDYFTRFLDRKSIFSLDFGNGPEGLFVLLGDGTKRSGYKYEVGYFSNEMFFFEDDGTQWGKSSHWHARIPVSIDKAQMLLDAGVKPIKK